MAAEVIAPALAYWETIRGERAMPRRGDLDPADIPRLLPFVMLVDVLENPLDFRFRLVGTEIDSITSSSLRGLRFSDSPHLGRGSTVRSNYETLIATLRPLTARVNYVGSDRFVRAIRHCLMPLSDQGNAVNMVFVAVEVMRTTEPIVKAHATP